MGAAGVPLVPGYHGAEQDIELLKLEADKMVIQFWSSLPMVEGARYAEMFHSQEMLAVICNAYDF